MGLAVQSHCKNIPVNVLRKIMAVDCENRVEHINIPHVHTARVSIF